jgi:hypothetical protein
MRKQEDAKNRKMRKTGRCEKQKDAKNRKMRKREGATKAQSGYVSVQFYEGRLCPRRNHKAAKVEAQ